MDVPKELTNNTNRSSPSVGGTEGVTPDHVITLRHLGISRHLRPSRLSHPRSIHALMRRWRIQGALTSMYNLHDRALLWWIKLRWECPQRHRGDTVMQRLARMVESIFLFQVSSTANIDPELSWFACFNTSFRVSDPYPISLLPPTNNPSVDHRALTVTPLAKPCRPCNLGPQRSLARTGPFSLTSPVTPIPTATSSLWPMRNAPVPASARFAASVIGYTILLL